MKEGVSKTGCFLLFLSSGVMERPYVQVASEIFIALCAARDLCSPQLELRTAIAHGKKIVLLHEDDARHGRFDFASEKAAAPDDLRFVLDGT